MTVDLDVVKTFYDPHPGFLGAAVPLPQEIKTIVDELNGKTISLRQAITKIQEATDGEIIVRDGAILLKVSARGPYTAHVWRLIRYK